MARRGRGRNPGQDQGSQGRGRGRNPGQDQGVWAEAEATIRAVQDQARAAQDQTRAAQDLTAIEDFLRQILIVAVEQRAGALSAEARERVATASVATLSGWLLEIHNSVDSLRNRLLGRDSGSTAPMRRCR